MNLGLSRIEHDHLLDTVNEPSVVKLLQLHTPAETAPGEITCAHCHVSSGRYAPWPCTSYSIIAADAQPHASTRSTTLDAVILDPVANTADHRCATPALYTDAADNACRGGTLAYAPKTLMRCAEPGCGAWWFYHTWEIHDPYAATCDTHAAWIPVTSLKRRARREAEKRIAAYMQAA